MIIDLLLFPLFLCFLYVLGAGTMRIAGARADDYPAWFYFTAALFAIGFISVVFNFFAGVASPLFYFIIVAIALAGAWQTRARNLSEFIWLGLILAPFAANMPYGPDAGLYHIPQQLWIRDEKMVFGLANFNTRFGFSSFAEYIHAPLWIADQFKLLSYTQAAYFLILLLFLSHLAHSLNKQAAVAGVLTLVALIINSKYFVVGYTSTDTPCGVFFAITFLYGFSLLPPLPFLTGEGRGEGACNDVEKCPHPNPLPQNGGRGDDKPIERKHLAIFFLCALFTFFSKPSGAIIFLWVLFVLFQLLHTKCVAWRPLLQASVFPAILGVIWIIRGVVISGCLLYPLPSSCLSVPWAATTAAIDNANAVTAWARQEGAGVQSLQGWSWISNWWWGKYAWFCLYGATTVILTAGFYRYCCREKITVRRKNTLAALIFTLLCLVLWFIKSPAPRFGIGVFVILPAVVAMTVFGIRRSPELRIRKLDALCHLIEPKTMISTLGGILLILLAAKVVIADAAGGRDRNYLHFTMLPAGSTFTQAGSGFGVRPVPGASNGCWLTKYCSPDYKTNDTIREKYGYKYFHE